MTTSEGPLSKGSLPISSSSEVALRRSTRNRQQPDRYGHSVSIASTEHTDPSSVSEANLPLTDLNRKMPCKQK